MMQNVPESEGCECWWPIAADRAAFGQNEKVVVPNRKLKVTNWTAANKSFHVDAGEAAVATVKAFYYPRWQAEMNLSPVPIQPNENGVISLSIPSDETNVNLKFVEPSYVSAANLVSIAVWMILLLSAAFLLIRPRTQFLPNESRS